MIRETILTSVSAAGRVHIAPLGIIAAGEDEAGQWIVAPFRPSTTLGYGSESIVRYGATFCTRVTGWRS